MMWNNIDTKQWTMNENWRLLWFSTSSWNVKRLDWSDEDHEISLKTVRIFNVLSSFVSIRSRCHSNGWKRQFHWRGWDHRSISTVSNPEWKGSFGRVLLIGSITIFGRDDEWFNCWRLWLNEMLCELFGNNGIDLVNEWFSDDGFVTQWCERESLGKGRNEFVWVGMGGVFVREQATARRNDGPPTCWYYHVLFNEFYKNHLLKVIIQIIQINKLCVIEQDIINDIFCLYLPKIWKIIVK